MTENGFSSVLLISSTQIAKGLTEEPSLVSGNPLEKSVMLGPGTPPLSLGLRRHLFSVWAVLPKVSRPSGLFTNIMLLTFMKTRFVFLSLKKFLTLLGNNLCTKL